MTTPQEILANKRAQVRLDIEDVFSEVDDETWRTLHPLGPVHVSIKCLCCGLVLARDLKEFGWLRNKSFVETQLMPHFDSCHV